MNYVSKHGRAVEVAKQNVNLLYNLKRIMEFPEHYYLPYSAKHRGRSL